MKKEKRLAVEWESVRAYYGLNMSVITNPNSPCHIGYPLHPGYK